MIRYSKLSVLTLGMGFLLAAGCQPGASPRSLSSPATQAESTNQPSSTKEVTPSVSSGRPLSRLIFVDGTELKWADVRIDDAGKLSLDTPAKIPNFPKLDAKQRFVQLKESRQLGLIGVRDTEGGKHSSGWILFHTGVGYIDHGDHGHWTFKKKPEVYDCRLDANQGNPAHVYVYDDRFFVANDQKNGYTRVDPMDYHKTTTELSIKNQPRFIQGGGNHITLAVVNDRVGYSAWIDGGGPNKGRVDVTSLELGAKAEPAYRLTLPSGVIHGAIANAGRVFLAPSEGICWVDADLEARLSPENVKIHHIDLGKDGEQPRRTGAFVNYKHHVLFVTGKQDNVSLGILDAKAKEPKLIEVPLKVKKGMMAVTPVVAVTPEGKAFAFVFHDHVTDVDASCSVDVIDLDPNQDGACSDATIKQTIAIGPSAVEGHDGHHEMAFDANRRYAFITNPGEGTIAVLSLKKLEIVDRFQIGGKPGAIIAVGGRETTD